MPRYNWRLCVCVVLDGHKYLYHQIILRQTPWMNMDERGRTYLHLWVFGDEDGGLFTPLSCNLVQYVGNPMKVEATEVTSDVTESVRKHPIGVRSYDSSSFAADQNTNSPPRSVDNILLQESGLKNFCCSPKNHSTSKVNLTMLGQCFKMIKYKVRKSLSRFKYDPILVAHQSQFQVRSDGNPSSWNPSTIARQCNNALDNIL